MNQKIDYRIEFIGQNGLCFDSFDSSTSCFYRLKKLKFAERAPSGVFLHRVEVKYTFLGAKYNFKIDRIVLIS